MPDLYDDAFVAFVAPLSPGVLEFRLYPDGADGLTTIAEERFSLMLPESELTRWRAVVPDADGVVRIQWE